MNNRLLRFTRTAALIALAALPVAPAPAAGQGLPQPAAAAAAAAPRDPYQRDTPRDTFLGFIEAAQSGNFGAAAEYLQWPRQGIGISKEEAARELRFVLNHGYDGSLDRLSRDPMGSLTDGLPPDKDLAGAVVLADGERVDIILSRVQSGGHPIWLFSAETVSEIPRMHKHAGLPEVEKRLPAFLTDAQFGGLPLWVPIALALLLLALFAVLRLALELVFRVVRRLARRRRRTAGPAFGSAWATWSNPLAFLVTLGIHRSLAPAMGLPLLYRYYYDRVLLLLLVGGIVWLMWRLTDRAFQIIRDRLAAVGTTALPSALDPGRKLVKGVIASLGVLAALAVLGVNLSAALAGVGLTSLVLAFAAQKTLENVFGGFSVLADRTIVVGDFCQIGGHLGEVEEVGLRSTRLRTLDRTIVHVPNGALATMQLENFARRDKFWFHHVIGLRYETTPAQLRKVRDLIRGVLAGDPRVSGDPRVRVVGFGSSSLQVELFAYFVAADYAAFLEIQEGLLLAIMDAVAAAGTGFAFPSQTTYLRPDAGLGAAEIRRLWGLEGGAGR